MSFFLFYDLALHWAIAVFCPSRGWLMLMGSLCAYVILFILKNFLATPYNLYPWQGKRGVLTTGPPGSSHVRVILDSSVMQMWPCHSGEESKLRPRWRDLSTIPQWTERQDSDPWLCRAFLLLHYERHTHTHAPLSHTHTLAVPHTDTHTDTSLYDCI